jgi:hypothetical protein
MSLSADPSPSADPAAAPIDPADYRRRRSDRIMGPFYWGLMIGALICVLAGVVVAKFLPSLVTVKLPQVPALVSHPAAPAETPALTEPTPAAAVSEPASAISLPSGQVSELSTRMDRIEAGQKRTTAAAGAALATASLVQAAQSSRPFSGELAAVAALAPDTADMAALRTIAVTGAPTRAALATEYADAAAKAAVAARAPAQGEGLVARATRALAAIVTVRRVDHAKGDGPDAVLARADAFAQEGDLENALKELSRLPPHGRDAMVIWRTRAQSRIDIDRHVAAIRDDAIRTLSQTMAATS